jgi:hypothetical protein
MHTCCHDLHKMLGPTNAWWPMSNNKGCRGDNRKTLEQDFDNNDGTSVIMYKTRNVSPAFDEQRSSKEVATVKPTWTCGGARFQIWEGVCHRDSSSLLNASGVLVTTTRPNMNGCRPLYSKIQMLSCAVFTYHQIDLVSGQSTLSSGLQANPALRRSGLLASLMLMAVVPGTETDGRSFSIVLLTTFRIGLWSLNCWMYHVWRRRVQQCVGA